MNVATTAGLSDLKFRLTREDFADAVAWVARNLPSRPTVPVLAGVLLTGSDEGLTVSGFDYEVSAEVQIPAEIASPGSALVSGRLLSDIVRALPAKPVEVSVEGTRVSLTCGSARFSLPTMAVEDYPTLPTLPDETGVVSSDLFAEAIGQVAVAAGRDDPLQQAVEVGPDFRNLGRRVDRDRPRKPITVERANLHLRQHLRVLDRAVVEGEVAFDRLEFVLIGNDLVLTSRSRRH